MRLKNLRLKQGLLGYYHLRLKERRGTDGLRQDQDLNENLLERYQIVLIFSSQEVILRQTF